MESKTSDWFEIKFKSDKTQDDGMLKAVTETYTVEALSFTEAEAKIIKEMEPYVSGEYMVKAICRAPYHEVFFSEKEEDDRWYKAKLAFITIDEATGKEKKSKVTYLLQAATLAKARTYIEESMNGTTLDYEVVSISETPIMDVFTHE